MIFYIFLSVFIVSSISVIIAFPLLKRTYWFNKYSLTLISFASGTLFGDAIIHLIPESFKKIDNPTLISILLLLGIIVFFVLEKFICWRHCHAPEGKLHHHPLVFMNLVGDGVHNFIDGSLIAGSFLISQPLGIATTIAVIAHEIPQEIGDLSVLIHSGVKTKRAIFYNFLSALISFLGAGFVLALSDKSHTISTLLIPFTAGGFLYIAGSDLIPEFKHHDSVKESFFHLLFMIIGITIMFLLLFLG